MRSAADSSGEVSCVFGVRVVSLIYSGFNVILLQGNITGTLLEPLGPGLPVLVRVENGG